MYVIPKKSVHLTNYYHKDSGGISTAYNHLLDAANRHERFVTLIVPGTSDETLSIGKFGKIHFVEAKPFPLFDKRYRTLLPQTYLFEGAKVREILLSEMPDLIEICDKYTLSWLAGMIRIGKFRKLGRPLLLHLSCERMDDNVRAYVSDSKIGKWISKQVMRNFIYPMFDYYSANSNYTMGELTDSMGNARKKNDLPMFPKWCWKRFEASNSEVSQRSFINECGVDTSMFDSSKRSVAAKQELHDSLGLPLNATTILYAGRLSPEKNVHILGDVLLLLRRSPDNDFKLIIAGDGPSKDKLEKKLKSIAPDSYRFVGHLTEKSDLANLYANVDVFIHPNPREPFGIGPLEAMSSGTPVVAPRSGGILSYCNDNNSWLVDGSPESFANSIFEILAFPDSTHKRVENALINAKSRTWENATDNIFLNYDQMIADFGT